MHHLARFSLANKAIVMLAALLLAALGIYSASALKQELYPSLELPAAATVSLYSGASPEVVEREVTRPLEDAVKGISGVKEVRSTTMSGLSQLNVSWDYKQDSDKVVDDIRAAVDGVRADLPKDVKPQVIAGSFDQVPIVVLSVASDEPTATLSRKLDDVVVPRLEGIEGVRAVSVSGQQELETVITLRRADLDKLGVESATIPQAIEASGVAVPAGDVTVGGRSLDVQVGRAMGGVDALKNVRLQGEDGPVKLADVATVVSRAKEATSISRADGRPSLGIAVTKESDGNTVKVAQQVRDALPELEQQLGGKAHFTTTFDQAPFIEKSIEDLGTEGLLGLVFAVLVIFAFLLSVRPTLIAAISIPLSLLIALTALWASSETLNIFTLGALTVAIGRVVDDSIVVIENIKRHMGIGERGATAIVGAVKEVAGAVTASTITTVAVFLPLGLVSGQVGELFRPFALTVSISLLASLVVSLTVVPVLASWFMRPSRKPESPAKAARRARREEAFRAAEAKRLDKERARAEARAAKRAAQGGKSSSGLAARLPGRRGGATAATAVVPAAGAAAPGQAAWQSGHDDDAMAHTPLQRAYLPVLRWSLAHRALTLVLALLVFLGTTALVPRLKTDFLGDAGQDSLRMSTTLPPGTSLAATDAAAKRIEEVLAKDPAVKSYATTVGGGAEGEAAFFGAKAGETADFDITLQPESQGKEVGERLRSQLEPRKDVGKVEVRSAGGAGNDEVAVNVTGQDLESLRKGSDAVVAMMSGISGLTQVKSGLAEQKSLLRVDIDPDKAARVGTTQAELGRAVSAAVQGNPIGELTVGETKQDLVLRSQEPAKTVDDLKNLQLPVTQKQTMDARKNAAEKVSDEQEALQDKQKADAQKKADEQLQRLREGRDKAAQQADKMEDQLAAAEKALAQARAAARARQQAPAPGGPVPGAPVPGGPSVMGDPTAGMAQQVAQLRAAVTQAREQVEQMDQQLADAQTQRKQADEQAETAKRLAQQAKDAQEAKGKSVRLGDVATIRQVAAPATITRVDGDRTVEVTAVPSGGDLSATTRSLQEGIDGLQLPAGVTAKVGGVSQDQNEAFRQLGLAMLIAIAIVFLVMVGTFRSLAQPFILLVSIPFAATGAIGLLLLTNTPLGLPAMVGMLMLIGIVVTNAIVLIDLVNQFREQGAGVDDAIVHGARLRLRPIIMTAAATICALLPMSLGLTGGGVFISKPLAIVVIGGLLSSTLLTLVLVPVLYEILERSRERLRRHRPRSGSRPAARTEPAKTPADPGPATAPSGPADPGPATAPVRRVEGPGTPDGGRHTPPPSQA